jgi:hypothetical protein
LSKQRYKDIKDQLKRDAVAQGLDFFIKAKESERRSEFVLSLGFYYQGFRAIEKYLGEPIRIEFEGKEILLTNEIIASMQLLLDKIELTVSPAEIILNRRLAQNDLSVSANAVEKSSRKAIGDLPLSAFF